MLAHSEGDLPQAILDSALNSVSVYIVLFVKVASCAGETRNREKTKPPGALRGIEETPMASRERSECKDKTRAG